MATSSSRKRTKKNSPAENPVQATAEAKKNKPIAAALFKNSDFLDRFTTF